jgi:hypothetical protein
MATFGSPLLADFEGPTREHMAFTDSSEGSANVPFEKTEQRRSSISNCRTTFELSGDFPNGQYSMEKRQAVLRDSLPEVSERPGLPTCDGYIGPIGSSVYLQE